MSRSIEDFSRRVVELLPALFREFAKREDNELTRGTISCQQMVVLDLLSREGKKSMKDIAAALDVRMSSASTLVDRLLRQKMLSRQSDREDRRRVLVDVTPRGKKVVAQILSQKQESVRDIFGRITPEEREAYLRVLLKVHSYLKEESR